MLRTFCEFVNCRLSLGGSEWTSWAVSWQEWGGAVTGESLGGDFVSKLTGKQAQNYLDPKHNLGAALLTACIPGILYGLNKYRQILCMYADCLETNAETGLPTQVCEDQKYYATCKYVFGEIMAAFPLTALFDYYMNKLKEMLSDPFQMVGFGLGLACAYLCPAPDETFHSVCAWTKVISMLGETIMDVQMMMDGSYWQIQKEYCDDGGLFGGDDDDDE